MTRLITCLCLLAIPATAGAADPTYWRDVRPLLRKHCTVCHSAKHIDEPDVSAGLALDTIAAIRGGGKVAVVGTKGADSLLVTILREKDARRRMPLDADPLGDDSREMLARWIDAGMPEGTRPDEPSATVARPTVTRKRDVILPTKATPPGAAPLELVLPVGPVAPVTAVAYSPDGMFLAVGNYGTVSVWDMRAGKPAKILTNVLGAVNDLKFSPDGRLLAVAGGQPSARGDLRLFQTNDWKLAATLGGHTDTVASVAFTPDGAKLASASFDKSVRLWDVAGAKALGTFTGHSDFVYSVAFEPKGQWFVTGSKDRTCRVVELATLKSRLTLSGMDQEVLAVGVTQDGSMILSSGLEPQFHCWNPQTGERTKRVGGHSEAMFEMAFSKDGAMIASCGGDKLVRLTDGKVNATVRNFPVGGAVYAVAIRPDGQQIAGGCFDGQVRIWEASTARELARLMTFPGAKGEPEWLALTPEGFAEASSAAVALGGWRSKGKAWDAKSAWGAVLKPGNVGKSLRGENLENPGFSGG